MRMLFAGHQFFGALADSLGNPATQEGAVIDEELQQTKVRLTQLVTFKLWQIKAKLNTIWFNHE